MIKHYLHTKTTNQDDIFFLDVPFIKMYFQNSDVIIHFERGAKCKLHGGLLENSGS